MYFALLIPIIISIMLLLHFKKEVVWWELILSSLGVTIFILLFRIIFELAANTSTEYRGTLITNAKYYEYWETWVEETCSYRSCTGSGKDEVCTTVYYDCSYCDKNRPYWVAIDNEGNSWNISEEYYNKLLKQWDAKPIFTDQQRRIDFHGRCGCDGDMYRIDWNKLPYSSEGAVKEKIYKNIVKKSKSAFAYENISSKEAEQSGLYEYPKFYSFYKQNPILGIENLKINDSKRDSIVKYFEFLNGNGFKTKNKTFILLFPDKDISIATKQEMYWAGGNRNELIICIGYDSKTLKLNWVKPFSWTDNKRVQVEIREELMNLKELDLMKSYEKVNKIVYTHFKPKDFNDFNYLQTDYPVWTYWFVWIMSSIIACGISYWVIINEFEYEN